MPKFTQQPNAMVDRGRIGWLLAVLVLVDSQWHLVVLRYEECHPLTWTFVRSQDRDWLLRDRESETNLQAWIVRDLHI